VRIMRFVVAPAVLTAMSVGASLGLAAVVDQDRPLSGSDHERATAAALQHVGNGTVAETEVGEGGAAAEVEIRLDDGRQVEVERAMTELGVPGGKGIPGGG
jgi:hypothetical protein